VQQAQQEPQESMVLLDRLAQLGYLERMDQLARLAFLEQMELQVQPELAHKVLQGRLELLALMEQPELQV
jgi:hypothetical protein